MMQQDDRQSGEQPLPLGFMMALAQNMHAMETYAALSDIQRAQLIDRAAHVQSRAQMQALVRNIEEFLQ
jgi:hypothetical protein